MAENKKPAIRFKGFTDAWEQRQLGEVLSFLKDGTHGTHKNSDEGIYLLSAKNIKNGEIIIDETSDRKISKEEFDVIHSTFKLQRNDVLLTIVGSIGEVAILKNPDIMTFQRSVAFLRPNEELISSFLKTEIESDVFQKELSDRKSQSAQPGVYLGELGKIPFAVPLLKEQQQIGNYFRNLDTLITLHQRKYDKLVKVKKSMLEKMFPTNGSKFPEIRFMGFTDAWEQRELGEIMDITSVKRIHQSDWTDSGIRFLRARDIVSAFKGEELSDYLYISEEKYNEYTALSGKVKVGDLLVTGVGTIGVPMLINSDNPIYFKDGNIIWFKNENKIDGQFFYYSFTNTGIQSYISESSGKGTVGTYTIESGKKTPILLPQNMEEQKAIGIYFRNLDHLITLHQRKLEKLKNIKKSMLQKMFL